MELHHASSTCLYLTWESPDIMKINGVLEGYKIEIQEDYNRDNRKNLDIMNQSIALGLVNNTIFCNLKEHWKYNLSIQVQNHYGLGKKKIKAFMTDEGSKKFRVTFVGHQVRNNWIEFGAIEHLICLFYLQAPQVEKSLSLEALLFRIFPYSARKRGNTDQKKLRFRKFLMQSTKLKIIKFSRNFE